MLSDIWFSVRGALSRAVRFWISGMAALRCGQPFRGDTLGRDLLCEGVCDGISRNDSFAAEFHDLGAQVGRGHLSSTKSWEALGRCLGRE